MSYTGQVLEIPLGPDGFTGNKNATQVTPGQLIDALNVSYADGTLMREPGSTEFLERIAISTLILGGWDWWPVAATQRMIVVTSDVINGNKIIKDPGPSQVVLATGITVTNINPVFVEGGKEAAASARKLFIFTGENPVQVLVGDGATTATIATPPADWSGANQPTCGCIHERRLIGCGNANDPHRIYYSTSASHEDFTGSDAGTIAIYPGEGERIVSVLSFKGLLIVWKYPRGIYTVDTSDATPTGWKVARLSSAIGGVSPNGHVMIDGDVVFMDPTGAFHVLSAITEFGNLGTRSLSSLWTLEPWTRAHLNLANLFRAQAVYYVSRREAHFAVPPLGSTYNSLRMVLDGNRLDFPRVRVSDQTMRQALWLRKDTNGIQRPVVARNSGGIWLLDQSARSGYISQFQTPHLDFSHADPTLATKRKNGQFLELVYENRFGTLHVDVFWDGVHAQTIDFNMGGGGGAVLGSTFILGSAILGGGSGYKTTRRRLVGSGRRLSLKGSVQLDGHDFSLARAYAHVGIADERRSP